MKIKVNSSMDKIEQKLSDLNSNVKEPNNFVTIQKVGDMCTVSLMANGEKVLDIPTSEISCMQYRDSFVGKFNFDSSELEIFTYADLHTHSEYSILDGANRIKDLAKKYAYTGAITDHGVMYGCVDFYKKMHDLHKKAILGFEAYTESIVAHMFNKGLLTEKDFVDFNDKTIETLEKNSKFHLVLLVKNETGYQNAMKLCSYGQANMGGRFPLRPRVSIEELIKNKEGLIILSACIAGEIPKFLVTKEDTLARKVIEYLKSEFGDDFYLEIQKHASECKISEQIEKLQFELGSTVSLATAMNDYNNVCNGTMKKNDFFKKYNKNLFREIELSIQEDIVNSNLVDLGEEMGVKVVATTDAHYLNPEDAYAHEALLCNQVKSTMNDPNHFSFAGEGYYVHTIDEMEAKYYDMPEVLINTLEVAEKCNFNYKFGEYKLPNFPIPAGYTDKTYLRKLVTDGFEERFADLSDEKREEYLERMEFELETIFKMGYQGYFFIVWDYIRYAKENNIYVGPGRGSGAGSIVLYCLHITENLDPLKFDLLFERD